MRNAILNILLFKSFFKKAVFSEKKTVKNRFWGPESLLKGRGCLATKMNVTFFMGNEILIIFSFNNFFEKNNIFGENRKNS